MLLWLEEEEEDVGGLGAVELSVSMAVVSVCGCGGGVVESAGACADVAISSVDSRLQNRVDAARGNRKLSSDEKR